MPVSINIGWSLFLGWARALLVAVSLLVSYWWGREATLLHAVLALYFIYAAAVAIRSPLPAGALGLLALFGDTVLFLILAGFGTERLLWLASLFLLYLLVEAFLFYHALEVCVVAAVCALFCAVLPVRSARLLEPTVVVSGALACGCAVSRGRQSAREGVLGGQLKEAQTAVQRAVEEERQRIASDFHDGPLQSFISLQMRLEIVRKLLERDRTAGMEDLKQLQTLAVAQIRDLRSFLHSMRPVDMDGRNLMASARRTAESFQKESGIPVTFIGAAATVGLPQEMSTEVLQMLREALHNVQKHAAATRVAVAMEKTDRGLEISVDDNGRGFQFAGSYTLEELELLRLGPASLKRRARSLNADLMLESRPGRGAGLKFRIPLQ